MKLSPLLVSGLLAINSVALLSCAGSGTFRKVAGSDAKGTSDFPDRVALKTKTETFDLFRYYVLRDGRIYFKLIPPGERSMEPYIGSDVAKLMARARTDASLAGWQLYGPQGLPYPAPGKAGHFVAPRSIAEISADSDQLLAISDEGRVYLKQAASTSLTADEHWYDGWGFPESPLILTPEQREQRSLVMGRRNEYVLYSEDPSGTQHHFGNMGTSSLYFLNDAGDELHFTDSGLPADFSHRLCGPARSTRRLEAISASASTMMVIDTEGKIYTKMEDYDLNGGSAMFFDYTYIEPKKITKNGTDVFSNWTQWKLPLDDWRTHPGPLLMGRASLSRRITILQNGRGNAARELRVAGHNAEGDEGYYSKMIDDPAWSFVPFPVGLSEQELLGSSPAELPLREYSYRGLIKFKGGPSYWADLNHFQFDCSPSVLRVYSGSQSADFLLHQVEVWIGQKRRNPGLDGTAKVYFGTIEKSDVSESLRESMGALFGKFEKKAFSFTLSAARDGVHLRAENVVAETEIEGEFKRTSADTMPPSPALADATRSFAPGEYSFLDHDGYFQLAAGKNLEIEGGSERLDVADVTLLLEKIKANREMRQYLEKLRKFQAKEVFTLKLEGEALGVATLAFRLLGNGFIPGVKSFVRRGRSLLVSYAEAGKWIIFHSEKSYQQAHALLDLRIAEYEATLKKITNDSR